MEKWRGIWICYKDKEATITTCNRTRAQQETILLLEESKSQVSMLSYSQDNGCTTLTDFSVSTLLLTKSSIRSRSACVEPSWLPPHICVNMRNLRWLATSWLKRSLTAEVRACTWLSWDLRLVSSWTMTSLQPEISIKHQRLPIRMKKTYCAMKNPSMEGKEIK